MAVGVGSGQQPSAGVESAVTPVPGATVLHATEALAAGVGLSLARLACLQAAAGVRPTVIGLRRYDTPDDAELRRWFGPDVELVVYPGDHGRRAAQLVWLAREIVRRLTSGRFAALHLHSSFAGAVGRILAVPFARRVQTFYSPHGFAFLRSDLSPARRALVLWAERVLALLPATLVLVSSSEVAVAARVSRRGVLLENGIDLSSFDAREPRPLRRPRVVMIGRIAEQKAPWRFAAAAKRFADRADFHWLGYGPEDDIARWLGDAPVVITGLMSHEALLCALGDADIVYFPTLWEGMPLSLIEAQASGLPVVASDIDGNRDIVAEGVTGYLRGSEESMLSALELLISDARLRGAMGAAAAHHAERFSDAGRGTRSFELYGLRGLDADRASTRRSMGVL